MALFSVYSLAAINYTQIVSFEWYSGYNDNYLKTTRWTNEDWDLYGNAKGVKLNIVGSENDLKKYGENVPEALHNADFNKYIYLEVSLNNKVTAANSLQIIEVSKRGNYIESKANIVQYHNLRHTINENNDFNLFKISDYVRIRKNDVYSPNTVVFYLKNQFGEEISKVYYSFKK